MSAFKPTRKSSKLLIFLVVFIDLLGFGIMIPMLPFFARSFGADAVELGWLMAIYSIMQIFMAPVWGQISDRWGRRPVLLITIFGQALAFFAGALSTSYVQLFFSRFFAGIFSGNISTASAYMADVTPKEERAKGMGLIGAAFGLGFIFGPAIGGLLIEYGIAWPSFAAAALATFNFIFAILFLGEPLQAKEEREKNRRKVSWRSIQETFSSAPLRLTITLFFLLTLAFVQLEITFGFYLVDHFHRDERDAGLFLAGMGLIMALVQGGLIGRWVKRSGEMKIIAVGLPLISFGLIGLIFSPDLIWVTLSLSVVGFGYSLTNPCLSALTSKAADPSRQGAVLGVYQSAGSAARVVGPLIAGFLYDRRQIGAFVAALVMILVAKILLNLYLRNSKGTERL